MAMLNRINQNFARYWCVIGNFNEMSTQYEKQGGRPWPWKHMEAFKLSPENNGLIKTG